MLCSNYNSSDYVALFHNSARCSILYSAYDHIANISILTARSAQDTDATTVIVKGIDKAQVGNYAANIRAYRRPEPYKGKGIKYDGEVIRRKEGKTGASS